MIDAPSFADFVSIDEDVIVTENFEDKDIVGEVKASNAIVESDDDD